MSYYDTSHIFDHLNETQLTFENTELAEY